VCENFVRKFLENFVWKTYNYFILLNVRYFTCVTTAITFFTHSSERSHLIITYFDEKMFNTIYIFWPLVYLKLYTTKLLKGIIQFYHVQIKTLKLNS
jgi:hypothetical protein